MSEPVAYLIDADTMQRLRAIADRLQGGSDRERDEGHRLWLALQDAELYHPPGPSGITGQSIAKCEAPSR